MENKIFTEQEIRKIIQEELNKSFLRQQKADVQNDSYSVLSGVGGTFGISGGKISFFGSARTTKPTITGSRGANAALASLLTALANLGLLIDNSS